MQWIDVKCPKCGALAQIKQGQSLYHASCPNRGVRSAPPQYQEVKK